jgi:hypothetical protein
MSYQTYDFEGQVVNVDGTATSLLDLSLAGEYALAESFAVRGRLNYSGASDIELLGAQAGLRYYPSPNFAVALGYRFLNSTLKADAFGPDMSVEAAGLTAELLLQF